MLRYAIKITRDTLPLIMKLNEGVTPSTEVVDDYFMTWADDASFNEIISKEEFIKMIPNADRKALIQIVN